jgi:hypothetical protein
MNKGDLVLVDVYDVWAVETPQKSLFTKHDLLAVIVHIDEPLLKVFVIQEDKTYLIHKEDIKCIVS